MAALYYIFIASIMINFSNGALIDEAQALLLNLSNITRSASASALHELWSQSETAIDISTGVAERSRPTLEDEYEVILSRLDDIKNNAADAEVNITECLGAKEDGIKNLLTEAFIGLDQCINEGVNYISNFVSQSLAAINNIVEEVFVTQRQLSACDRNDESCIQDVISTINFQTTDLPRRILEEQNSGLDNSREISVALGACGIEQYYLLTLHGGAYLGDIGVCVDRIINDKSTTTETVSTATDSARII